MEWRERSDLKTGTRGTRDGFLLVLVLVLVGGGYQPLCPFPRHRFVFPLKTASSSSQRETAKGSAVSCRVEPNPRRDLSSLLFSYQDLVNPFHCPTLNLIIIYWNRNRNTHTPRLLLLPFYFSLNYMFYPFAFLFFFLVNPSPSFVSLSLPLLSLYFGSNSPPSLNIPFIIYKC